MKRNFILDFNHIYTMEEEDKNSMEWIDCSDLTECNLYCSKETEEKIKERIKTHGIYGIHFIDSGNYHYITKFMVEQYQEPFSLVLIDHHTDMQKAEIEEFTSCGGWAKELLESHPYLQQLILIGPRHKNLDEIQVVHKEKILGISYEEIDTHMVRKELEKVKTKYPIYISIDKDVLDEHYAKTNWNQGDMSLTTLEHFLDFFLKKCEVIGIDICGEYSSNQMIPEYYEARRVNHKVNEELYHYLRDYFRPKQKR